ncbi:signal peptide peptidase SppA [Vibrio sp.]|nr:signal peptide peptidase SppA [Vibrio sp.]
MMKLFRFIGRIIGKFWKLITWMRRALANLFFIAILAFIYFAVTTPVEEPLDVKEGSALVLNITGDIVDQAGYVNPTDSFRGSLLRQKLPRENVLFDIVSTIRHAENDPNIKGIVLALRHLPETSLTKLRYIGKALGEFKASGKSIYATGDFYNQSQYYLASYADKVFLAPDGAVSLKGYSTYNFYYKSLLEKLDVTTHVFRVGTYKSAVEPVLRDDMSDESRESAERWTSQLWSAYVNDVARNRQINPDILNPTEREMLSQLDSVNGSLSELSTLLGLVDELATRQEIRKQLSDEFGSDGKDGYNYISYYEYQSLAHQKNNADRSANEIAVIVAKGAILDGVQPRGTVGGDSTASLLRQAKNNPSIKAVVLRVDSPGGSAHASEVIRNEILALREAGKPVVTSMSSLAASGGYWIAMNTDQIIAQPTTLTGSIGIFAVFNSYEKIIDKYNITLDGVATSPIAGDGPVKGLSDTTSKLLQMNIENGYQRFIGHVANGREMTIEQIDNVAQGRVWTGQDALDHGLVDMLGDFDDAVTMAAELASIDDYSLNWVTEPLSPTEQLILDIIDQVKVNVGLDMTSYLPKDLQPLAKKIQQDVMMLNSLNDPKGQYLYCLNCQIQ